MAAGDNSEIRVIAQAFARPENVAAVREILKNMLGPTRKEKGCILYDLHEAVDDPHQFVFFEIWESADALDAHTKTPHFHRLESAQTLLSQPLKITKLTAIA